MIEDSWQDGTPFKLPSGMIIQPVVNVPQAVKLAKEGE